MILYYTYIVYYRYIYSVEFAAVVGSCYAHDSSGTIK